MTSMKSKHHSSIRMPLETLETIDAICERLPGTVSRNTWIALAIQEKLDRDGGAPATEAGGNDNA